MIGKRQAIPFIVVAAPSTELVSRRAMPEDRKKYLSFVFFHSADLPLA